MNKTYYCDCKMCIKMRLKIEVECFICTKPCYAPNHNSFCNQSFEVNYRAKNIQVKRHPK